MTPEEFSDGQRKLRLSDPQLAFVLGFENPQHIRRLRAPQDAPHGKRVMPHTARLMHAYLSGYRPDDWPIAYDTVKDGGTVSIEERLLALEAKVFGGPASS